MGEVLTDFGGTHFLGVSFFVEEDEVLDPIEVGVFRAPAHMFEADSFADAVEQFRLKHGTPFSP